MTSLTDDVCLRTSDDYGSWLQDVWDFWLLWLDIAGILQEDTSASPDSPITHVALNVTDYFQASIHNALVGYYRVAFASLRSVIENMVVGLHLELAGDRATFLDWLSGGELRFGSAVDYVITYPRIQNLEHALKVAVGDDLFHQRRPSSGDGGGLVRRFFRDLSQYVHAAPNHNDADIWESNGPVFVGEAFKRWTNAFLVAYALGVLHAQLARPNLNKMSQGRGVNARELFLNVIEKLPTTIDARQLLKAVPGSVW